MEKFPQRGDPRQVITESLSGVQTLYIRKTVDKVRREAQVKSDKRLASALGNMDLAYRYCPRPGGHGKIGMVAICPVGKVVTQRRMNEYQNGVYYGALTDLLPELARGVY